MICSNVGEERDDMLVFQLHRGPEAVFPAPSAGGEDLCGQKLRECRGSPQQAGGVLSHRGGAGNQRPGGGSARAAEEQRGPELPGEDPRPVEEVEEAQQRQRVVKPPLRSSGSEEDGFRADPEQTQVKASEPPEEPGLQSPGSTAERRPGSLDSARTKCVQLLLAALLPDLPDLPDLSDQAAELAAAIEEHIHQLHKPHQLRYKNCVRSKVANLRNPRNQHLRRGLLSGSLLPDTFARMSAEEMAGPELQKLRQEICKQGVSERQLPQQAEGTPTQKIRCRRCGGSDCRVTQVSRGALFLPAWVRRGGPDEDAMTFVICSVCGQQWYHSSWNCL